MIAINLIFTNDDDKLLEKFREKMNAGLVLNRVGEGAPVEDVLDLFAACAAEVSAEAGKEPEVPAIERLQGAGEEEDAADDDYEEDFDGDDQFRNVIEITPELEDTVAAVRAYIRLHLSEELSIRDLARQVGLHHIYLSSVFKSVEGVPIHRYILKSRLDRAAYLLATEMTPVSEISARVGFNSDSYFNRMFKKEFDITPRQYRLREQHKTKKRRPYEY